MRLIKSITLLSFMLSFFSSAILFAQSSASEKKKQTVNFEEELIQGEIKRPDFFFLMSKKQFNFGRLIKLRENFLLEMRKTSEDIQRSKGDGS